MRGVARKGSNTSGVAWLRVGLSTLTGQGGKLSLEIWDLVDVNGNPTGKTIAKTARLPDGIFHLGVDIWIRNAQGEYLIQKRAATKRRAPNMWMATGGSVLSGESGIEAVCREAHEELRITLNSGTASKLFRVRFDDNINEVWLVHQDITLTSIILKPDEVCDVRWVTQADICELVLAGEMIPYHATYLNAVFDGKLFEEILI
jgi:isopentenyldiphosphate isomerase